jgi:hypothetical protein
MNEFKNRKIGTFADAIIKEGKPPPPFVDVYQSSCDLCHMIAPVGLVRVALENWRSKCTEDDTSVWHICSYCIIRINHALTQKGKSKESCGYKKIEEGSCQDLGI